MPNTTWNPSDKTASVTLSGGNLVATLGALGVQQVRAVDRKLTGKYYWEITPTVNSSNTWYGLANGIASGFTSNVAFSVGYAVLSLSTGQVWVDGATSITGLGGATLGTPYCFAVDLGNRLFWVKAAPGANWNASATANPATGLGGFAIPLGVTVAAYPVVCYYNATSGAVATANFGDGAFVGAVPSDFTAGFPTGSSPPLLTSLAGLARETLLASEPGIAYLGGLVRESLISGYGIDGATRTKSQIQGQLTITGGIVTIAGGAGGGGAAGLFGPGEFGQNGVYDGTGGYGGAGDNYLTPRQLTPSTVGNIGHEWDGTYGSGSGGSGGSWGGSGHGGNGGVGGLYGGGGGGGGGGLAGGGLGALGGEGVIYLEYDPGTGPIVIILTKDSPTSFTVPLDWSTTNNTILIVGAGGCGKNGGLTTGGGGGGGGSVVGAVNTSLFTPGQVIPITIPSAAQVCAGTGGNTVFGGYSAPPGRNGDGGGGGTPAVPIDPSNGGIPSGPPSAGGGGGPGTGGAGGGVATLMAVRAEGKSLLSFGMVRVDSSVRQHAVSVQTWHW